MEEVIIDAIFDAISKPEAEPTANLCGFADDEVPSFKIEKLTNILQEPIIQIKIGKEYYTISCTKTFVERGE